jgi:hypothetical protein
MGGNGLVGVGAGVGDGVGLGVGVGVDELEYFTKSAISAGPAGDPSPVCVL